MARARNIKPGFFVNERLADCSMAARLLFIGLWTVADRKGRLKDIPRRIGAEIFPYEDIDCETLLAELASSGFIVRYEVEGKRYIAIVSFLRHQAPHRNEKESEIPPYIPETLAQPVDNFEGGNVVTKGDASETLEASCGKGLAKEKKKVEKRPEVAQGYYGKINDERGKMKEDVMNVRLKEPKSSAASRASPKKTRYAEYVYFTEAEFKTLCTRYGDDVVARFIEILNSYKGANGKEYKSDYFAVLTWVVKRYKDDMHAAKKILAGDFLGEIEKAKSSFQGGV